MTTWRIHEGILLFLFLLCAAGPLYAGVPAVPAVPEDLPPEVSKELNAKRDLLAAQRTGFLTAAKAHNQRCHDVPLDSPEAASCAAARDRLTTELSKLQQAADALQGEISGAAARAELARQRHAEQTVSDLSHGNMQSLPPDFPRLEEIGHSPGVEAWRRGMDAVINHDWQLALAWFQTAQQKDPANPALGRAVELAQWMRDQRRNIVQKTTPSQPLPPAGTLQLPKDDDLELLFPDYGKDDIQFLCDDIKLVFPGAQSQAPVTSAPDTALSDAMISARHAFAHELGGQAMIRIMEKDYAGAAALLDAADKQAPEIPNYRNTRDLVRSWIDRGTITK